jgi:hypothetical protein
MNRAVFTHVAVVLETSRITLYLNGSSTACVSTPSTLASKLDGGGGGASSLSSTSSTTSYGIEWFFDGKTSGIVGGDDFCGFVKEVSSLPPPTFLAV